MSFKSIGNTPRRKMKERKLMTIAQCWDYFRSSVIPADAEPATIERARMVFYAGAAFYQDQILAIGDLCNIGLSEDDGEKHLQSLGREIDEFAGELAIDLAFKMPTGGRSH